ncbi:hypothetical protein [Thiocapsa sp. UBA6158]|jgi:hypothetical protein|uniref:hypothetical protein n=1 Tax=Thiocapsa sp. UBA6158 TaxID=1947692 RepID=UPI0025EC46FA|nr:hypothetical protein [Thiocapsa sp. UBA6158]
MLTLNPGLPTVPPRAADSFDTRARAIAGRVSQSMARHPNLDAFLVGLPFRPSESNHRNHPVFMSEVLSRVQREMRHFHSAFGFGDVLDFAETRFKISIFQCFKTRQLRRSSELAQPSHSNT